MMKVGASASKYVVEKQKAVELEEGEQMFLCNTCGTRFALQVKEGIYIVQSRPFTYPRCSGCASTEVVREK